MKILPSVRDPDCDRRRAAGSGEPTANTPPPRTGRSAGTTPAWSNPQSRGAARLRAAAPIWCATRKRYVEAKPGAKVVDEVLGTLNVAVQADVVVQRRVDPPFGNEMDVVAPKVEPSAHRDRRLARGRRLHTADVERRARRIHGDHAHEPGLETGTGIRVDPDSGAIDGCRSISVSMRTGPSTDAIRFSLWRSVPPSTWVRQTRGADHSEIGVSGVARRQGAPGRPNRPTRGFRNRGRGADAAPPQAPTGAATRAIH